MKLPDSKGGTNHIVPFSNGALRPPHVKQIGPAFPLFLLYEDKVTKGEGKDGVVLGGRPVTDGEMAKELGLHQRTAAEHRLRLAKHGYIATKRTGRGYVVSVKKSKKVLWLRSRRQGIYMTAAETAQRLNPNQPNGEVRSSQKARSRSDNLTDENSDGSRRPTPTGRPGFAFRGRMLSIARAEDQALREAFAGLDLEEEYRKMDAWLATNPLKKPRSQFEFAQKWLTRAADGASECDDGSGELMIPRIKFGANGEPSYE